MDPPPIFFLILLNYPLMYWYWGWSGGAKVLCILLILAYSWARPAIFVAGKGRGGLFLFLLFLHFHSCSSFFPVPLFHLFYYLFFSFLHFSRRRHNMAHNGSRVVSLNANTINKCIGIMYANYLLKWMNRLEDIFKVIAWSNSTPSTPPSTQLVNKCR